MKLCCCFPCGDADHSLESPAGQAAHDEKVYELSTSPEPIHVSYSSQRLPNVSRSLIPPKPELRSEEPLATAAAVDPWEDWKLNREFFHQVYEWNTQNPENKLHRFLLDTCNLMDQGMPLLQALPDGMFPLRGFLEAMAHLFMLGVTVSQAKRKVAQFAQEIMQWFEKLADTLEGGRAGSLTSQTWKNLNEIHELIQDVCRWAYNMMNESLADGLKGRLTVDEQLAEYKSQFAQATDRFMVLFAIGISRGLDTVITAVEGVSNMMSDQKRLEERRKFLKKRLLPHAVEHATYSLQSKHPCDPHTRNDILNELHTWFSDVSNTAQCFYWLSGEPGVGKSAITASIARECTNRGILGAQFFINRNDVTTTDPRTFFPSISWQLCEYSSNTAAAVEKTLQEKHSLIDDISHEQAGALFVEAIRAATISEPNRPVVIVIDALDETDTKRLHQIAQIFSKVVVDLPHNAKVFISSRVEDAIRNPFDPLRSSVRVKSRYLAAKHSIDEVARFLERKVKEIMRDYDMPFYQWGEERTQKLCAQASGLYLWAQTALKFLRSQIENYGTTCFGKVLDELNTRGMDDINTLYLTIIRSTGHSGDWEIQRFRRIVGAILVRQSPLTIGDLKGLLNLQDPIYSAPVDVEHFIRQYRTVLIDDTSAISATTIPRVHKSFADFITSERAQEFRVDKVKSHGELSLQCLRQIDSLAEYLGSEIPQNFPTQLPYISLNWSSHLSAIVQPTEEEEIVEIEEGNKQPSSDTGGIARKRPQRSASKDTDSGDLRLLSVAISPDGTRIASGHGDSTARIWDCQNGVELVVLRGHTDDVNRVIFSHDGARIATASDDTTVRIWDTQGGVELSVFEGHGRSVCTVVFSPDDTHIATSSLDNTIRIWNGTVQVLQVHTDGVPFISISPSGHRLASSSNDLRIGLWELGTGVPHAFVDGFRRRAPFIAFSTDGQCFLSSMDDDSISIWDSGSGRHLSTLTTDDSPNLSFTGSKPGEYIVTPQPYDTPQGTHTLYSLDLVDGMVYGVVRGGRGSWVYTKSYPNLGDRDLKMSNQCGQLVLDLAYWS